MPVLLLLCHNNFLLFNHILPRETTKKKVPSPSWTNGCRGNWQWRKSIAKSYHQVQWPTWPDCMEGNEYKLLLMDKVQCWVAQNNSCWSPPWFAWRSRVQRIHTHPECVRLAGRNRQVFSKIKSPWFFPQTLVGGWVEPTHLKNMCIVKLDHCPKQGSKHRKIFKITTWCPFDLWLLRWNSRNAMESRGQ